MFYFIEHVIQYVRTIVHTYIEHLTFRKYNETFNANFYS